MSNINPVIQLNPADDVVIARVDIKAGTALATGKITVVRDVPAGHKIAVRDIAENAPVKRYGQIIGFAACPIAAGDHVHMQNLKMGDFSRDYAFGKDAIPTPHDSRSDTFMGIVRPDGGIATRNFIGIITTVNCSATVARAIEDHFHRTDMSAYPNIDGVVSLPQNFGCGIGGKTETMDILRRTIGGYVRHPNFAGVLVLGLGCEANQINELFKNEGLEENGKLKAMTIQGAGGTRKAINQGVEIITAMLADANNVTRQPAPVADIILALECGGSDGYSGISANPALGYAVDKLVRQGGTAILSETPEIFGAEHLLTRRAVTPEVGEKLIGRIAWWEEYCRRTGTEMNNNPSAGNKAGGLTTILEKSLGAIAKGGSTNLTGVYEYAETVTAKGLVFMDTPGYDPIAVTGQIAGGANVLCFTTGRGSAFGSKPVPSIKICSNNILWRHQEEDMDINCGNIVEGTETIAEAGERIYQMIIEVASGNKTKSELFGYGSLEFVPWINGAIT